MDFSQDQTESLASERLRKAIERNKKKQELRDKLGGQQMDAPPVQPEQRSGGHFWDDGQNQRDFQENWTPPRPKSKARPATEETSSRAMVSTQATRRSVGSADDIDFAETIRKATKKVGEILEYNPGQGKGKRAVVKAHYTSWPIKAAWAMVCFALLRLVFVNRGVIEYYQRLGVWESKQQEFRNIKKENIALSKEIDLIKTDSKTQKRLVRDHLGFIAEDEFLILFPRENRSNSI